MSIFILQKCRWLCTHTSVHRERGQKSSLLPVNKSRSINGQHLFASKHCGRKHSLLRQNLFVLANDYVAAASVISDTRYLTTTHCLHGSLVIKLCATCLVRKREGGRAFLSHVSSDDLIYFNQKLNISLQRRRLISKAS